MQGDMKLKKELLAKGHGEYNEIEDEKAFFDTAKKSDMMVCHFYRDATWRCQIVDKHLDRLAKKYWKCKFVKINAEKSQFLVERLKVSAPTLPHRVTSVGVVDTALLAPSAPWLIVAAASRGMAGVYAPDHHLRH